MDDKKQSLPSLTNVIDITPHQLLGRLETVTDFLNAYALTRTPMDDRLLGCVERLRELHRELGQAIQRQRLRDQLNFSLAVLEQSVRLESPKPPAEKL